MTYLKALEYVHITNQKVGFLYTERVNFLTWTLRLILLVFLLYPASWLVFRTQCQFSFTFLIGAFRSASGYKFRPNQLFPSVCDVYTLRIVRREKLLRTPYDILAVHRDSAVLYISEIICYQNRLCTTFSLPLSWHPSYICSRSKPSCLLLTDKV